MRSVCLGFLGVAFLSSVGEGAQVRTGAADHRSFANTVHRGGVQSNISYRSLEPSMPLLTATFAGVDNPRYEDTTLPYLQGEPSAPVPGWRSAAPPEGGQELKDRYAVEEAYRSVQRVDPALAMKQIDGIKSLLCGCVAFLFFVAISVSTSGEYVSSEEDEEIYTDDRVDRFMLAGAATGLLLSGLVALFTSLRRISRGHLEEDHPPRIRGIPMLILVNFFYNFFLNGLLNQLAGRQFIAGVGVANFFVIVATFIQFIDYKLKHTDLVIAPLPEVSTGEMPSSISASTPQLPTQPTGDS